MVDNAAHERAGGHTIARHVGKSEQALRQRLALYPRLASVSTFLDRAEAEAAIDAALQFHAAAIRMWLAPVAGPGWQGDLTLHWHAPQPLGRRAERQTGVVHSTSRIRVVLRSSATMTSGYVVLTAFPVR